ncbi:MAG TPA: hypothetical protein PKX99_05315 [Thermoanaerobaculia bacterium]|nr:hypothetical protein [Thermoanaerobaculia bacterium]
MRVKLARIAHARSGDKGDASNVGLVATSPEAYELLRREVTPERVRAHFAEVCRGEVERFEVPNLLALNFLLHDALGGGGTASLLTDAQGKTHGQGLLEMEIEVPEEQLG